MGLKSLFSRGTGKVGQTWTFDTNATIVAPPATADLVGDGRHQVLVGTKDGHLICLDETGKELWRFTTSEQVGEEESYFLDEERVHGIVAAPIVADVNNDKEPEIVFGTEKGILYCLSRKGKLLWDHDCGGSIRASPAVADLNSDGNQEILVGSANNRLTVLTGDGHLLFEYMTENPIESTPGVMRGSRSAMIVFGTNNGTLIAITPGQEVLWKRNLQEKITAAPLFFQTKEEQRMVIGTTAGRMFCVSEHGEQVWVFKTEGSIYSKAALEDLDGDGTKEIVFSSCDNNVYAVTLDGKRVWSYQTDFWVTTTPIVADLDGDGQLEVIAGSYDKNVYVLDSKGTYVLDYVPGLSGIVTQAGHYSDLLTSDPGEQTGKKRWQFLLDDMVVGCALMDTKHPVLVACTKSGKVVTLSHER